MSIKVTDENGNVVNSIPGPTYTIKFPICSHGDFYHYCSDLNEWVHARYKKEHEHDLVHNPPHYNKHPSGIECIQVTRHMNFNLGNAVKYIWRADLKNDAIEDLKKAAWYIQDEIQRREKK